ARPRPSTQFLKALLVDGDNNDIALRGAWNGSSMAPVDGFEFHPDNGGPIKEKEGKKESQGSQGKKDPLLHKRIFLPSWAKETFTEYFPEAIFRRIQRSLSFKDRSSVSGPK